MEIQPKLIEKLTTGTQPKRQEELRQKHWSNERLVTKKLINDDINYHYKDNNFIATRFKNEL